MAEKKRSTLPVNWLLLGLIASLYVMGFAVYPRLPDMVPSHWNVSGQVDGYMSKTMHVLFMPTVVLGMYLLLSFAPAIDPKPESYEKFRYVYGTFRTIMVLIFSALYIATTLYALGVPVSIGKFTMLAIGLMFVFVGNYMGKIRHNYTFGIKTPWTLANEEVWNKTHRISGPLWVIAGFIWILGLFLEEKLGFFLSMGSILAVTIFGFVYSYLLFKKMQT
ncbi:Immunity protein SdpI [Fervidicola ferrireducens]|uniref:Immunity protein SdpI n=1 Tax=Fervidicola ferrireducens TaxID=520764 RepID=A0A140LE61_9FIRM|nr:SdpI family protein [Fervidicola ferrireducens]KXG78836.1 Immunity protein SdpI [Fervidicola ferrireducens]